MYEYMPNSSLDKFIFFVGLGKRLSFIHGTALALDYLHNGSKKRVLNRDI